MNVHLRAIVGACALFLAVALTHAEAQYCTPTSSQSILILDACTFPENATLDSNRKVWQFTITWPDGATDTRNNMGSGQCFKGTTCTAATQETDCWAQFNSPVAGNGSWSEVVYEEQIVGTAGTNQDGQQCFTYSCGLTGQINTAQDSHTCTSSAGGGGPPPPIENCGGDSGCSGPSSPIVIDTKGTGFELTSAKDGVLFDFLGTGTKIQIAWTAANSGNAWLVLDRNHNGLIDNGTEMFGNITPQPPSSNPNGFLALAVFDEPANGGNGNGVIDPGDAIFSQLQLWIDANHDGISQPDELFTLPALGIARIGLPYVYTPFTDQYGNQFRYLGVDWDDAGNQRQACYDVFLETLSN